MRSKMRKPIAVLLSALLLLTIMSVGFVVPVFAVDTTALDAAIADANALTAANYVDFSGVTAAVNAAADTTGKSQTEIDDMEDAIRVALAKLELTTKYSPQTIRSTVAHYDPSVVYVTGFIAMNNAYSGHSLENPEKIFEWDWDRSWYMMTNQRTNDVYAHYYVDHFDMSDISGLVHVLKQFTDKRDSSVSPIRTDGAFMLLADLFFCPHSCSIFSL